MDRLLLQATDRQRCAPCTNDDDDDDDDDAFRGRWFRTGRGKKEEKTERVVDAKKLLFHFIIKILG